MNVDIPVLPLKIAGGGVFRAAQVWFQGEYTYKTVAAVTVGWPTVITATAHGIPAGIKVPVWIAGARGGPKINTASADAPWMAERVTDDTLRLLGLNTLGQSGYVASSATLAYVPPKNLTGFTGRVQFRRDDVNGEVLVDGDTVGGELVITGAIGKVELVLTEAQVRSLLDDGTDPVEGIAQVELIDGDGDPYRPWDWSWRVTPEGTREA